MRVYVVTDAIVIYRADEPEIITTEKMYWCLNDFVGDVQEYDSNYDLCFVRKAVRDAFCAGKSEAELKKCEWYEEKKYKWTFELNASDDVLEVHEQIMKKIDCD